jgi:serine/threonine protein kinase
MDLMAINLAKVRRCLEQNYSFKIAIHILSEMLTAIREVHERGFIHRDVKASNFVLCRESRRIYIVDFGLAKRHLDQITKQPLPKRRKVDFRGTVSFASLNAHNNVDLARRDDIWSYYFTMMDFLNEKLEWREQRDYTINQVKDIKTRNFRNPKKKLWVGATRPSAVDLQPHQQPRLRRLPQLQLDLGAARRNVQ